MPVEEYCDHNYCSHRDCSDIDCSHCAIWLLPQQLKDQVSEIVEVLTGDRDSTKKAALRRLFFESFSQVATEMAASSVRTDDEERPRRMLTRKPSLTRLPRRRLKRRPR